MTADSEMAVQVIDRAMELIATPELWTKKAFARDSQGKVVNLLQRNAVCFCLWGALKRAMDENNLLNGISKDVLVIYAVRRNVPFYAMTSYNDKETTTHADILAVLSKARTEIRMTKS